MNLPADSTGDNRWNLCLDALVALWNRTGPDATLAALRDLELAGDGQAKDAPALSFACGCGHEGWYDPKCACCNRRPDKSAAATEGGA